MLSTVSSRSSGLALALMTTLALAAAVQAQGGGDRPAPSAAGGPRVSLENRSRFPAVLARLHAVAPVLAADVEPVPATLAREVEGQPLREALARVSVDFDRCCLRRGEALTLQSRFSLPHHESYLRREELAEVLTDLERLFRPIAGALDIRDQQPALDRFFAGMTPEQFRQAQSPQGLPLTALREEQRKLWLQINTCFAYADELMQLRRGMQCLANWKRASGRDGSPNLHPRRSFNFHFPNPFEPEWDGGIRLGFATVNIQPRTLRPEILEGPALPTGQVPGRLRARWDLPLRVYRMSELAAAFEAETGLRLLIPAYARDRAAWVGSRGGSRGTVLDALALLWGWRVTPTAGGYRLDRPQFAFTERIPELHTRLREAIPPALWHLYAAGREGSNERRAHQGALLLKALDEQFGKGWRTFESAKLDAKTQQRLAEWIATQQVSGLCFRVASPAVPGWLSNPERGRFILDGELGPNRHPMFWFRAPDDQGKEMHWGVRMNDSR